MSKFLDDNGLLYLWSKIVAAFVGKEAGKGLSTNDLTTELKAGYDGAATHAGSAHAPSDAEKNVQSDWNQTTDTADDFIKNKPTIPSGVVVDSALSDESENAVQNKVIKAAIDGKVAKNDTITGATKAKITYDAKGLVTAGADLEASDIPDLSGTYVAGSTKGQANGVAGLGADGLVPSAQLPSFVDDVVELITVQTESETPPASCATGDIYYDYDDAEIYTATGTDTWGETGAAPEKSKIFVDLATNLSYRWGGSAMVQITSSDMTAITNLEIDAIVAPE